MKPSLELNEPPQSSHEYVELRAGSGERAFIAERVLRDAKSLTRLNLPNETGAVLMGRTFTDGRHAFAIVTDLIQPLPGEVIGTVATVEITAEGRRRMEAEGRLRDPLARAIGWMHSHPVQRAFFSDTDLNEQRKLAGEASVGLVVSGRSDADPRWRVFLGADASEALEHRFAAGAARRPPRPDPQPAGEVRTLPEPGMHRRVRAEDVAPDAERPELDWPRSNEYSATDAGIAPRPSRTLSRISDAPMAARASSTRTVPAGASRQRPAGGAVADHRFRARAGVQSLLAIAAIIVIVVIIVGLLNSGVAATSYTVTSSVPRSSSPAPFNNTGASTVPRSFNSAPFSFRSQQLGGEAP